MTNNFKIVSSNPALETIEVALAGHMYEGDEPFLDEVNSDPRLCALVKYIPPL